MTTGVAHDGGDRRVKGSALTSSTWLVVGGDDTQLGRQYVGCRPQVGGGLYVGSVASHGTCDSGAVP